jgi:hypothetical protein
MTKETRLIYSAMCEVTDAERRAREEFERKQNLPAMEGTCANCGMPWFATSGADPQDQRKCVECGDAARAIAEEKSMHLRGMLSKRYLDLGAPGFLSMIAATYEDLRECKTMDDVRIVLSAFDMEIEL